MSKFKRNQFRPSSELPSHPQPQSRLHTPVALSFRYVEPGGKHCLSECQEAEVRAVMDCLRRLTTLTWQQVRESGRKGEGKKGIALTPYDDHVLTGVQRPPNLDKTIQISGVRAGSALRVFGAYHEHVYYILWIDRTHGVVP